MRKLILLVVMALPVSVQATGIPTIDVSSIAARAIEYAEIVKKWQKQAEDMSDQFNKLKETHTALTGVRGLGDVLDNPLLNQYLPEDWNVAYQSLKTAGLGGLAHQALAIYEKNHVFDDCAFIELEDVRRECQYRAVKAAKDASDAYAAYATISLRVEQISELKNLIYTTVDPKGIAEITARIQSEQTAIANEQMRLDSLRLIQENERQLQEQRQREFAARSMLNTGDRKLEPIEFD